MNYGIIDTKIAEKKIKLNGTMGPVSSVSTLWKGEVVTCMFDNTRKKLTNVFCWQTLAEDDLEEIDRIVHDFVCGR